MAEFDYIKRNLEKIKEEINGRASLVAVTKSASDEELIALASLGASDIAENRPQELVRRHKLLTEAGFSVNMHQIGTLQRNKVKMLVPFAATVQSLDSVRLADEISKEASKIGRTVSVLIEVNSACENQKSGVLPSELAELVEYVSVLPYISLKGLMTMGPVCENSEELRPYFRLTRELFLKHIRSFAENPILSMGMSESYLVAIEEGANLVRVGRSLFTK
jgi:pyridoxal phosphate enzyme (YggS family)